MSNTSPISRIRANLGCLLGYAFHFSSGIAFSVGLAPLVPLVSVNKRLVRAFVGHLFHLYMHLLTRIILPTLGVYRIREMREPPRNTGRGRIIVANHRGMLDGTFILSFGNPTVAVMKAKHAKKLPYSFLVKTLDYLVVDPGSLTLLESAFKNAKRILDDGIDILVFPEGTRTSSSRLLPFQDFAFKLARETHTEVIPIAIHTAVPFMGKSLESWFPGITNTVTVRALAPLSPDNYTRTSDFAEAARTVIMKEIATIAKEY